MATIKEEKKKALLKEKRTVHCETPDELGRNCMDCVHCMIKEPWCEPKCYFPNHVMNKFFPGLVCEDFGKRTKQ